MKPALRSQWDDRRVPLGSLVAFAIAAAVCVCASTAAALPPGMHYELVSPSDTGGTATQPGVISADGSRMMVNSNSSQGFAGTPSFNTTTNYFVATRKASGWATTPLNAPAAPGIAVAFARDISADLTTSVATSATSSQFHASQLELQLVGLDGSLRPTFPLLTDFTGTSQDLLGSGYLIYEYAGSSADLSHAMFATTYDKRLLPADGPVRTQTGHRLYEVEGVGTSAATLRRVDVESGGAELGSQCGTDFAGANSMSRDGSKIFFTGRPGANGSGQCSAAQATFPLHVLARVGGSQTVDVSASECQRVGCSTSSSDTAYLGASPDGRFVLFSSADQLADSDLDAGQDLYRYDFSQPSGHRLTQLSVGDASGGRTPGSGANVLDIVQASDDGSRIYFLASGVLTTGVNALGQSATLGGRNLYLYEPATNKTTFVTTISSTDQRPAGISALSNAAGDVLVFTSKAQLVPSDTDSALDVYRYDATGPSLVKITPGNTADDATTGPVSKSGAAAPPRRIVSSDGKRVVFATATALDADNDVNGKSDVYLWDDGSVQMVSDGHDSEGVGLPYGLSADGNEIAFGTFQRLVPEDADNVLAAYVARAGADIERAPVIDPHCTEDACQGDRGELPIPQGAGAPADGGLGNLPVIDPTYRVPKLSTSQRTQLAKNGSTKLAVTVSEAGQVVATASGLVDKRTVTVGSGKTTAAKAGVVNVTLKLTKAARSQLASAGKLTSKLTVTFSKVAPVQTQTVKLTKAKPKAKAKKESTKKRSSKRASSKPVKRDSGR